MPTPILETLDALRREGETLLRELEMALMQGHLANRRPSQTASPFEGRFRDLDRRLEAAAGEHPQARSYVESLRGTVRSQQAALVERAQRAFEERSLVEPGLAASYNEQLGKGLAYAPRAGREFVEHQVGSVVRRLVDTVINDSQVPGHVRGEIAGALTEWIKRQEHTQDALYAVEAALFEVANYLHQALGFQGQILATRDQVRREGDEVSQQLVCQADQRVGQLAQACRESERQVEARIQQAVTRVRPYFSLQPRLVLDPARAFLSSVQAQGGIRIRQNQVTVDLGAKIKVVDPTRPSAVSLNPSLGVTSGNLGVGVNANSTYRPGTDQWEHSFRVDLRWTF